jgi:2-hydroxy-3-keto-5-methylthiopentenyl-1-phosphate phosphatase
MKFLVQYILASLRLKEIFFLFFKKIKRYCEFYLVNIFNIKVFYQYINYKSIPIIIISFNQLYYFKQLIEFLQKKGHKKIIVIDNNSTYKPLLDYFKTIENSIVIHRLNENNGHMVFWKIKDLFEKYSKGFYVISDADVVPNDSCPSNFLKFFIKVLIENKNKTKVGFSLKIDDIPETNPNKSKVIKWETQFNKNILRDGNYNAQIDTTFALYRPGYKYNSKDFFKAIRTKKPYFAIHGGWYLDINNLTEEQNFYFKNCNNKFSSWKIDSKGRLFTKDYE